MEIVPLSWALSRAWALSGIAICCTSKLAVPLTLTASAKMGLTYFSRVLRRLLVDLNALSQGTS